MSSKKILTSRQIGEVDQKTMSEEGITSLQLIDRAATAFFHWVKENYPDRRNAVALFAGYGNNGNDALVVARYLNKAGYPVNLYIVKTGETYSEDYARSLQQVEDQKIPYAIIQTANELPDLDEYTIIVDAIFGTGLNRELSDLTLHTINHIHASKKEVISVDVPSGLFMDKPTPVAVHATHTVTFQIPKLALYLPGNHPFVGHVWHVDIGLSQQAIKEMETHFFYTGKEEANALLKPLNRYAHKGMLGHAFIVGGSIGMFGSVCLASKAALRTGCGLVTAYLPRRGVPVIQSVVPEVIALGDKEKNNITRITYRNRPDAIGIGVGMGKAPFTMSALHAFLERNSQPEEQIPLVLDADALNILSLRPEWLPYLQKNTILTPHPKELQRLIGEWSDDFEKIQKTREFARVHGVIVVIKGAFSMVVDQDSVYVNGSGTPALATAGSGDVLTGMVTSLLAQGYAPLDAARFGVFLHGYTADVAGFFHHERSFIASDIIENIGNAYSDLELPEDGDEFKKSLH